MNQFHFTINNYLYINNYKFIICLSNSFNYVRDYIDKVNSSIKLATNWNNEYQLYSMCMQHIQDNRIANIHIFFNPDKQVDEQKIIYGTIERLENELKDLKTLPENTAKYENFFDITKESNTFTYKLNNEKVIRSFKTTGYILFLTTDLSLTPIEVLKIYRKKDIIEKNFNNLKNELDYYRLRTHLNKTTDGKIFVGFIALILRSHINTKLTILKKELKKITLTIDEIILEFEKIKVTTLDNEKTIMMQLTKTQKQIFKTFNLSTDLIKALNEVK